jgi:hypothetical protein
MRPKRNSGNEPRKTNQLGMPSETDGAVRWILWGIEAPARWAAHKLSIWILFVLLAGLQLYFAFNPVLGFTVNIMLAAIPLGAAYAAYSLSQETKARWWQLLLSVVVAGLTGFLLVYVIGAAPGLILIGFLFLVVLGVAILLFKIATGGDEVTGVGGATYLKIKPKVGEVYWGEIVNSDGIEAKHRPVIITRVRGENIRVFYTTSQEKREGQRGYIELTREGWDNGDKKRSFVLIRDSRILHLSQLGSKLGELSNEDRQRLGMDAYHD